MHFPGSTCQVLVWLSMTFLIFQSSVPVPLQQVSQLDTMVHATQSMVSAFPGHSLADIHALQDADTLLKDALVFWRKQVRPNPDER